MIQATHLFKSFGDLQAVTDISFEVHPGEVVGFLGPNGAGKSTTMKMLAGFLAPNQGEVLINGFSITEEPKKAKAQLGYLPESAASYKSLTVAEFLGFVAQLRGITGQQLTESLKQVVSKTQLHEVLHKPISKLSKGFRQRVGFAQALIHDPSVLILDEPTDGLDPNQKHEVRGLIRSMAKNKAILLSTHILEEMEAVCDRVILIDQGKVVITATPAELLSRSKTCGAIEMHLAEPLTGSQTQSLSELPGVSAVNSSKPRQVQVLAKPGAKLLGPVHQLLNQWSLEPEELFVLRGQLDEVFRDLTLGTTQ